MKRTFTNLFFTLLLYLVKIGIPLLGTTQTSSADMSSGSAANNITFPIYFDNDPPVIINSSINLPNLTEDVSTNDNTGILVSDLISGSVSDLDGDPIGIAVISRDADNGTWQFLEGGNWWNFDRYAIASETQAMLFPSTARIRFIPGANFAGTASISYRAWDQTSGAHYSSSNASITGGYSAFSATTGTATVTISAVNDAPVILGVNGYPTLKFDGANDNVSFADPGISGDYTIEAWIYVNQHQTWARVVDISNGQANNNILFAFQFGTNRIAMETYNGSSGGPILTSPSAFPTGVWKHVASVNDGAGKGYLYIDGVLVASGAQKIPGVATRNLNYFAKSNFGQDANFNGNMREMRIWDVARTQTQIQENIDKELAGSETGLKVYYKANETTGTTLTDASGNGKTGTLNNGTEWITSGIPLTNLLVIEDTEKAIPGLDATDPDAGSGNLTMTLTTTKGVLKVLTNITDGLTSSNISGNSSKSITINGTIAQIKNTLSAKGLFYVPELNYNGADQVTMNITDNGLSGAGGALSTSFSFAVTVLPVNDLPIITSTAVTAVNEDELYSYTVTATDVDAGTVFAFSAPVKPAWLNINATTGVLSGTPTNDHVGEHDVTVRVSDGTEYVEQSFTVIVANVNDAPVVNSKAYRWAEEDVLYSYTIKASDVDVGDILTYSAPVIPNWLTFDATTQELSGTPTNDEVGEHDVTLRVSDGIAYVEQIFTVIVENVNDAPEITSVAVTTVEEGQAYSYTFTAIDVDIEDELTFSAEQIPSWLSFDATTGKLTGNPTHSEIGTYDVTLRVTDGIEAVDQTFVVTVKMANYAPVITSTAVLSVNEDEAYQYTITASDVNIEDILTYSAPVKPSWLTFDVATSKLTGTPSNRDVGTHSVKLIVSDGKLDVEQTFTITVINVNDAPTITSIPVTSTKVNASYTYTVVAIDEDVNDVLSYSAVNIPTWLAFNPSTRILSGAATKSEVGKHSVTLSVSDGKLTAEQTFSIEVILETTPPTISPIKKQEYVYGKKIEPIEFSVGSGKNITITVSSDNQNLVADSDIIIEGSGETRILKYTTKPNATGTAWITLRVSDGETIVEEKFLVEIIYQPLALDIPDLITPNGDNRNETWNILNLDSYMTHSVRVFNKTGDLLFHSTNISKEWDGTFRGKSLPEGVYYFVIELDKGAQRIKGTVSIER